MVMVGLEPTRRDTIPALPLSYITEEGPPTRAGGFNRDAHGGCTRIFTLRDLLLGKVPSMSITTGLKCQRPDKVWVGRDRRPIRFTTAVGRLLKWMPFIQRPVPTQDKLLRSARFAEVLTVVYSLPTPAVKRFCRGAG